MLRYVMLGLNVLSWWCQRSFYDENFFRVCISEIFF